jgi:hypothetical protein
MMSYQSIHSTAPAVFVFDPATGDAVSLNSGAVQLVERFGLSAAPRLTLAAIERGVIAGAKTKSHPIISHGLAGSASELRRECRRADGSVLALSRVWAPGSSTMLVIEDMTTAEQERRRQRIWQMVVAHMAQTGEVAKVLDKALRMFCLLSRSPGGEVWLPVSEGTGLIRRSMRISPLTVAGAASAARLKSPDESIVGQAWSTGKTIYTANRVAIPMHAGNTLVSILVLDASPACPSDYLAFSLIESLAPTFGLALLTIRQGEELLTLRTAGAKSSNAEGARITRSGVRAKPVHVVASLRAAG